MFGRHRGGLASVTAPKPGLVAVDDEPAVLAAVARDLRRGFGERYRIMRAATGAEGLDLLRQLRTRGDQVAVLAHKLRPTRIEVVRDCERDLPRLTVRGSELNQVWTNLLDNAIHALDGAGTIAITTREPDLRSVLHDQGRGPGHGLGLATALRIVADRHDGSLTVESRPGRTVFRARLPFTQR
jgi:nitrogen-specific signal transduction histidine kinase